jgi:hypothetical protein
MDCVQLPAPPVSGARSLFGAYKKLASKAARKSASSPTEGVKKPPRKRRSTSTRDPWTTKKRKSTNKTTAPWSSSGFTQYSASSSFGGGGVSRSSNSVHSYGGPRSISMAHPSPAPYLRAQAPAASRGVPFREAAIDDPSSDEDKGYALFDDGGASPTSPGEKQHVRKRNSAERNRLLASIRS